jgi:hypothetical protein
MQRTYDRLTDQAWAFEFESSNNNTFALILFTTNIYFAHIVQTAMMILHDSAEHLKL